MVASVFWVVARVVARVLRVVTRVFWVVARVVARVFWVVARVLWVVEAYATCAPRNKKEGNICHLCSKVLPTPLLEAPIIHCGVFFRLNTSYATYAPR